MKPLVLIEDYRLSFYSKIGNQRTLCTMDTDKIVDVFRKFGYATIKTRFADIDLSQDWNGIPIIYASSEDIGSLYKSYIEDIMLALQNSGAILIPDFLYLRAHHNKSFMEALRYKLFPEAANDLKSRVFGTYEELVAATFDNSWPKVIKAAFGAGSTYVAKAEDHRELLAIARKFSRSLFLRDLVREYRYRCLWKGYIHRSLHRNKFVVQSFIKGLNGDFKVLKYGKRYYLLFRNVRKDDFRASGSGDFSFDSPINIDIHGLLNFAKTVTDRIGTPLCSLDIGFDGTKFHLIEYQCLSFGTLTAEKSDCYHCYSNGQWLKVSERCDLESVFCEAIADYLEYRRD